MQSLTGVGLAFVQGTSRQETQTPSPHTITGTTKVFGIAIQNLGMPSPLDS